MTWPGVYSDCILLQPFRLPSNNENMADLSYDSTSITNSNVFLGKIRVCEFFFEVPVNYSNLTEGSLRLFARSLRRLPDGAEPEKEDRSLPWLLYLNGGPGIGTHALYLMSWTKPILDHGYEVSEVNDFIRSGYNYRRRRLIQDSYPVLATSSRPAWDGPQPTNNSPNVSFTRRCLETG